MEKLKAAASEVINVLIDARSEIEELFDFREATPLKKRLVDALTQQINSLSVRMGQDIRKNQPTKFGRVTKMLGKDLTTVNVAEEKELQSKDILTKKADDIAAEELSDRINEIYPVFNTLANEEIIDSHDEYVIRGIAIKAGLPVTENFPEKINSQFIDEVKAAITTKADLDRLHTLAKETGSEKTGEEDLTPPNTTENKPAQPSTEVVEEKAQEGKTVNDFVEENDEQVIEEEEIIEESVSTEVVEEKEDAADQPGSESQPSPETKATTTTKKSGGKSSSTKSGS